MDVDELKEQLIENKKWVVAACAAVLVVVALLVFFLTRLAGVGANEVYVQPVSNVNLASGGYANRYSGVVESQKTQKVTFDTSRRLGEVKVEVGDHVERGDVLFTYDTEATELQIQQVQIEIERLETTIANNTSQISDLQGMMSSASSEDRLAYSAQIQELQAATAQAEYDKKMKTAELERLQASVEDPSVRAEISGTVESIAEIQQGPGSDEGGAPGGAGDEAFMTILADGDFRIRGKVSEQNIYDISVGDSVIVRSRVDENTYWQGTISSIETKPEGGDDDMDMGMGQGEGASNYAFLVSLDSVEGLMLGQHVTIEVDYGQGVPRSGIWLDGGWIMTEDDGTTFVWATGPGGGRLERREVALGSYDADLGEYEIVSGLSASDMIAWPDSDCVAGAPTTTIAQDYEEAEEMAAEPEDFADESGDFAGETQDYAEEPEDDLGD